jgi:hypothetical protein
MLDVSVTSMRLWKLCVAPHRLEDPLLLLPLRLWMLCRQRCSLQRSSWWAHLGKTTALSHGHVSALARIHGHCFCRVIMDLFCLLHHPIDLRYSSSQSLTHIYHSIIHARALHACTQTHTHTHTLRDGCSAPFVVRPIDHRRPTSG